MIVFDGEVVVSNDDGDGFKFSSESNLWEKKTKAQLARYVPDILGDYVRRIQNKCKTEAEAQIKDGNEPLAKYWGKLTKDLNLWLTRSIRGASGMKNIWTVLKSRIWDNEFESRLNVNHDLFPTMDGNVVDLRTGESRKRKKEDMFSFACPVRYVAQPNLENVMRFVNSIFCDNQELIDYMWTRMGMFLTGRSVREFDIWYGNGKNGKSSLCRILGDIMKTGNFYNSLANGIFISNPKLSQSQKSGHTSHLVPLIGVRLGICQEIDKDSTLNGALIKSLSAGDPFKCRGAFEKLETEHIPFCKLVLCVNPKPKFDADDQAIVDRARYIPFNARFVDEPDADKPNEKLADKLFAEETMTSQEEKDNFFSWLVGGAVELYANNMKLKTPQLVIEAKQKSVADNDVVSEF